MVSNEIKSQIDTELRHNAEIALMAANGEITKLSSQRSSLVIGISVEEEVDFTPQDYPESLESETNEYDTWLG